MNIAKLHQPLHEYQDNAELAQVLAGKIAQHLAEAIAARGTATLAVSGGSTPLPLFQALSQQALPWSQVMVTQVDERWVEEDHPDSNARLIRENLLQNNAQAARFLSMKTSESSPFDAQRSASDTLQDFAHGIDVVVLGMGADGHTASFFPGAATLEQALDPQGKNLCVAIAPPNAPHQRMTLALPAILQARHCYLHISGPEKLEVLQQAATPGPIPELPIRAVLRPPLEIYYAQRN